MAIRSKQQNTPSGWNILPIGRHIKLQGGNAFSASNYVQDGIPLVRIGNVGKGDFVVSDFVFISEDEHSSNESVHLRENDILMGMTGELGKVARIKKQHLPAILNQRVGRVVFKDKDLDPDFTFQVFLSEDFKSKLEKYFIGAAQKNISSSQVESVEVLVPPFFEQQKIAEILGTVDEDISKTQEVIEVTEKLKRGLMQQLFTRGIGHTKFKETKIGRIPEEWDVLELGKVCDVRDGTHSSPKYHEEGYPLITSKNLVDNGLDFDNVSLISQTDFQEIERRSGVDDGDILFGMIGTIGNPVIVKKDRDFAIKNVALIKFNKGEMDNVFVLNFLKSTHTEKQFNQKKGGSTQKFIALGVIRQILITVPSVAEQRKIAGILSVVDEKISVNKKLKAKLILLKKGLMQDLLSGNVRVN